MTFNYRTVISNFFGILPKKVKKSVQSVIDGGCATPLDVDRAEQIFYVNYLQEGMIVFDVGANIGEMTLLFSHFSGVDGRVFSFEACSTTFKAFESNCRVCGRKNIYPNNLAVSDKIGFVDFHVYPDEYSGWNTLADRPLENYGVHIKPSRCERVQSTTIDRFCEEHNIKNIDLLKIDVEGAEYQVLLGAERMLRQKAIKCCVFEFGSTTFDMGNTPEQIENYLTHLEYSIRNIVPGNPSFPGRRNATEARFSIHVAEPV
ncbi:MAG: FkbM family methyltransferase [Methanoregula sp.]